MSAAFLDMSYGSIYKLLGMTAMWSRSQHSYSHLERTVTLGFCEISLLPQPQLSGPSHILPSDTQSFVLCLSQLCHIIFI